MRAFVFSLAVAAALLAGAGCSKSGSKEEPGRAAGSSEAAGHAKPEGSAHRDDHRDEPEHEELPRHVQLKPEVIAAAGIKTTVVVRQKLAATRSLPGEITTDPDRTARVSSPVAGRLEQVWLSEGSPVKKGDKLATIRVPELGRIRGAQLAAAARAKAAHANADRLADLAKNRLTSEQAALDARAEADAQSAEAHALGEQLAAMGTGASGSPSLLTLRAPVAGVVVSRDAVVGQPVAADQVLGTVADLSEMWFLARVFEKDLASIKVGAAVDVQLNAYAAEHFAGVIELIGQQIDPVARTVTARVRLKNRDGLLRLGLFGSALVSIPGEDTDEARLVVPQDAVTDVAGKSVVFVQQTDGDFEMHPVVLGRSAPGRVDVLSGLRENERVVSEGVFSLKSVVLKSTLAEED